MTELRIPLCAVCSKELPPPETRGRPRRYCSARCRKIASLRRRAASSCSSRVDLSPAPSLASTVVNVDEQVVLAVAEAFALADTFLRLGEEAHPRLAARCELFGQAMQRALDEHFRGVLDVP